MSRTRSRWVCQECGFVASRFLGRCTECDSWGSLVEELDAGGGVAPLAVAPSGGELPSPILHMEPDVEERLPSGFASVDGVLGGGFVPGSVVLFAGDPGIGKSTLLLQIADHLGESCRVLYVCAEESRRQVGIRARRLSVDAAGIFLAAEQNVLAVEAQLKTGSYDFVVIDSIQAVHHPEITSAPGSVGQTRECAAVLVNAAKARGVPAILVGHVTKDGGIAGPRVLEHMVDVVLHFEGDRARQLRVLRAVKNRFGSTSEIAIFAMEESGLSEVDNPSLLFLGSRLGRSPEERAPSGTAVIAALEGNRPLLLEVQALVASTPLSSPRRTANGWDVNRLLQILAVLEKRVGLAVSRHDVYVNIVGGFTTNDPAGDLGIALAAATSYLDRSVDPCLVAIGELGLSGEIRPVAALDSRLREAARMGFRKSLVPAANQIAGSFDNMEVVSVEYLVDALSTVIPGFESPLGTKPAGQGRASAPGIETTDTARYPEEARRLLQPGRCDGLSAVAQAKTEEVAFSAGDFVREEFGAF